MLSAEKRSLSVLIPDGECYITRYVVNCLAQVQDIKVYIMSSKKNSGIRYSRYVSNFSFYPKTDSDLEWIENINREVIRHDIDIVMPIWEVGVKVLAAHREMLPFKHKLGLLPTLDNFNTAVNKWLLAEYLDRNQIPNPKCVLVNSASQVDLVGNLQFPILIKPLEGMGGGHGIRKFDKKGDFESYYVEKKIDYTLIAQEYIEGYDIDCSVLCQSGEILAYTIQRGNMMDERKFAPQIGLDFLHEPELYNTVAKLMKSLDWSGVAHIDMRFDHGDRQFKVIEINARYWGSLDASLIAGVNFPYLHVLASQGTYFERPRYEFVRYLSLRGLTKMIKQDTRFLFNVRFMLENTPLSFSLKDPLPMLYNLFISSDHE